MAQHRNLLPWIADNPSSITSESSRQALAPNAGLRRKKPTRERHSAEEWEEHKPLIQQLYDSHELKDVIRIMEEKTGFKAGIRRYKTMLATWGQEKYVKGPEMQFVLQKHRSRESNEQKATSFIIRDTQLEIDQIFRFQARYQTSQKEDGEAVSGMTPEGIQYFTPRSPLADWDLMHQSPHAFTPTSRRTAFATALCQASMSDIFIATILAYDRPMETKQVEVKLRSPRKKSVPHLADGVGRVRQRKRQRKHALGTSPLDENGNIACETGSGIASSKRHSHQIATFAGLGNGRFSSGQKVNEMLWQGLRSALDLGALSPGNIGDSSRTQTLVESSAKKDNLPEYWLETSANTDICAESLIAHIRKSTLARRVLGLTNSLYSSWLGNWRRMQDNDALILKTVANHCFGDPFLSFSSLALVSVIIKIEEHSRTEQSCLLRVTYGRENRSEFISCGQCEDAVFVLDFSGPSGALKIQVPTSPVIATYATTTFKSFLSITDPRTKVFNSKLSLLAHRFQGLQTAKHLRRCHCNGRVHERGFQEHYIDMEAEITAREEKFDPNCLREVVSEEVYQPHPPDIDTFKVLVESSNSYEDETSSETDEEEGHERWDPDGDADSSESEGWDPDPSEDEAESHYVTQAIFQRVR